MQLLENNTTRSMINALSDHSGIKQDLDKLGYKYKGESPNDICHNIFKKHSPKLTQE